MQRLHSEFQHLKIQLEDIKAATGNFDNSRVIGKGGFGMVFEGLLSLPKGQIMVAFKRLDRKHGQGNPEFWKEIQMLSRHTHENLISLLGFCDEDGEKILVYEHASHGSLDYHLDSTVLTWRQRLKICIGAANGLCHLHDPREISQERIIHRDIKSANVLLDENWHAKLSDFGLSKVGPAAKQQDTVLFISNVAGTHGYVDPVYWETSILTKESDTYSFGVVLFEVLCGERCFDKKDPFRSVQMWKRSYEQNKLDEIVFVYLKQQMDPKSLETFSDIAYRCLKECSEERPQMSHVVEKLDIALRFQEIYEEMEQPMDYEEMSKTAVPPLVYRSQDELKMLLSQGILVNGGKTWFLLNKEGQHCEMISAAECLVPIQDVYSGPEYPAGQFVSRFEVPDHIFQVTDPRYELLGKRMFYQFVTNVRTQFLSPHITYAINLVFNFNNPKTDFLSINYKLSGETNSSTSYIVERRDDGWSKVELYQFTCDTRYADLGITFVCKEAVVVEGIEFQPLERVEKHEQVLEDEEVDMQPDTYWEEKLPTDYEDIIKWSKDSTLQWTSKKELYSILCKGFPINDDHEWLSLAKNGKICHMLPAILTLQYNEWLTWKWRTVSCQSRSKRLALDPHGRFSIYLEPKMLSLETTYGTYLVYKLKENHSGFEAPVKVTDDLFYGGPSENDHSWYIYLQTPQIPVIRPKVYQNTHNPLYRPDMKGLPQQRNDEWMEVQVWEFHTGAAIQEIKKHVILTIPDNRSLKGLLVQGVEFKPI